MKYLVYSVEDDENISSIIKLTLVKQGYRVETFLTGKDFQKGLKKEKPNMVLLDLMLPDMNGIDILKKLRNDPYYDDTQIIIISAANTVVDKVGGLDEGADDYIEKPFSILELMSRVNSKVRRYNRNRTVEISDIKVDFSTHTCYKKNELVKLTNREFEILEMLFSNKGKSVDRKDIMKKIWGVDSDVETRAIDMHIKSIRKKIDPKGDIIKTVYGFGYKV